MCRQGGHIITSLECSIGVMIHNDILLKQLRIKGFVQSGT